MAAPEFPFLNHAHLSAGVSASREAPGSLWRKLAPQWKPRSTPADRWEPTMADEQGRWFKVFASITESDVFGDAQALRCWIWCLKSANWKPQMCKRQMFPRGTFWCNIREAASECRCAVKTWDQAIEHLVKLGMISVVRSPKCITITVVNYDRFQCGIVVKTTTNSSTNGSRRDTSGAEWATSATTKARADTSRSANASGRVRTVCRSESRRRSKEGCLATTIVDPPAAQQKENLECESI